MRTLCQNADGAAEADTALFFPLRFVPAAFFTAAGALAVRAGAGETARCGLLRVVTGMQHS